jgi:CRISPR-associated protein Cas6/Cse3/CasE, subtype I-E/ECOLI
MPDDKNVLNMLRLVVDQRKLFSFAKNRNIPLTTSDAGYPLHCLFTEVFGPDYSPKPFAIDQATGPMLSILAYSNYTKEELENQARIFAKPEKYALLDWNRFAVKPMPSQWQMGKQLSFEVRVCPVERKSNAGKFNRQKGAEMDVYLCHVWKHGKNIDRSTVYENWTSRQIEKTQSDKQPAAKVLEIKTQGFRRINFIRRDNDRTANKKERPEAFLKGVLEIGDPHAFTELLRRGIGRHRAFGFGMLLLKPVT